jgi:hypothetical protein
MELNLEDNFEPKNPDPVVGQGEEFLPVPEPVEAESAPVQESEEVQEPDAASQMLQQAFQQAGTMAPTGMNPLQQYAPGIAEAVVGAIPGTEEMLQSDEAQGALEAMKDPIGAIGAAGMYDFFEDLVEFVVPSADVPELPESSSKMVQALRNLYSIIGPSWGLAGLTRAGGTAALTQTSRAAAGSGKAAKAAKYLEKLGKDRLFTAVAQSGITLGSGSAVDYINKLSQEGDNFFGMLRKSLPEEFHFLAPETLATTAADGADDRRRKSVLEGAFFSTLGEVLPFIIKFQKRVKNLDDSLDITLENDTARGYQKQIEQAESAQRIADESFVDLAEGQSGDDLLDALDVAREKAERAGLRRAEQLEELSQLADDLDPALDQPMLGRNQDQFDIGEQGIQTVDEDAVRGAMIDNVDIANNTGTIHGRLRNMVSEAALKAGLNAEKLTARALVKMVSKEIDNAGEFGYTRRLNDEVINNTYKDVDEKGTELSEYLMDPMANKPFLKGLLQEYAQVSNDVANLTDVGMNAVGKAIKFWTREYFNLNDMKASALLQTSMAGQASDIAEGARRFDQPGTLKHAQKEILDRLEFMQTEYAIGQKLRGQSLNFLNTWKRVWELAKRNPKKYREYLQREAEALGVNAAANVKNTVAETKEYFAQLRELATLDPEMMRIFMLTNELTDGNVHTMSEMTKFWKNNFGVFRKMIVDGDPKYQSVINNAAMGNMYNSILSAPDTANMAGLSNAFLVLQKPMNSLVGNSLRRNWDGVRKGWYTYMAMGETLREGLKHAGFIFSKLSQDPSQVPYVMRESNVLRMKQQLALGEEFAKVQEARGNLGPRFFVGVQEYLEGMGQHPVARFGTNLMGAYDGLTRAVMANGIARSRAYDEGIQLGDMRTEVLKNARDKYRNAMRDENGYIVDPEVEFSTREMSMALDHPVVEGINALHKHIPALKIFTMFAKTTINVTGAAWNNSFLSKFAGDYREIIGPNKNYIHTKQEIEEIFKKRGMPIDSNMMSKFEELQGEIFGRVAVSSAIMGSLMHYILSDNCHGDGNRDPRIQGVRDKMGEWPRRSCRNPVDGRWYSFDSLPPGISQWINFVANVGDNFDTLGLAATEKLFEKAHWVLAASLTKQQYAQGLEPLIKFLSGNPKDMARFSAQNANALMPLSSMRSDLSKLLIEGTKELNNTFEEGMLNRNRWTEIIDPDSALPTQRSEIDGSVVGGVDTMYERIFNFLSPVKVSSKISPEKQFLMDIEYDSMASLLRDSNGVEYTPTQRADVRNKMGEQLHFRNAIRKAMKMAEDRDFIGQLRRARYPMAPDQEGGVKMLGFYSDKLDKSQFQNLFTYLDTQLERAKVLAEQDLELQERQEMSQEAILKDRNESRVKAGLMPILRNK